MATSRFWLLLLKQEAWQLIDETQDANNAGAVSFPPDGLVAQAAPIVDQLASAGYRGEPVVIALDGKLCLSPTIEIPSPQVFRKPQALHYLLEQWIPWSAEDYVTDVIGHEDRALTVAMSLQPIHALIGSLEQQDVSIPVVAPLALLALQWHLLQPDLSPSHILYWHCDDHIDSFEIRSESPLSWAHLPSNAQEIERYHGFKSLSCPAEQEISLRCVPHSLVDGVGLSWQSSLDLGELTQQSAAFRTCSLLVARQSEPLINLRTGQLAAAQPFQATSSERSRLKLAVMVMLACVAVAMWLRSEAYSRSESRLQAEMLDRYESLFPSTEAPERIPQAFRSELRRLQGTRAPTDELPHPVAADYVLQRLLAALPKAMRFRFSEIRIERDKFYIAGEVRSNADADRLAASLRSSGFRVDPPRMQRLSGKGFSVRLDGQAQGLSEEESP